MKNENGSHKRRERFSQEVRTVLTSDENGSHFLRERFSSFLLTNRRNYGVVVRCQKSRFMVASTASSISSGRLQKKSMPVRCSSSSMVMA